MLALMVVPGIGMAGVQLVRHILLEVVQKIHLVLDGCVCRDLIDAVPCSLVRHGFREVGGRDNVIDGPVRKKGERLDRRHGLLVFIQHLLLVRSKYHRGRIVEVDTDRSIRQSKSHTVLVNVIKP